MKVPKSSFKKMLKQMSSILDDVYINDIQTDGKLTTELHENHHLAEIDLMLLPLWTLRLDYRYTMIPLDSAMESYIEFSPDLQKIDERISSGEASKTEVYTAFSKIMKVMQVYNHNRKALRRILRRTNGQLAYYASEFRNLSSSEMTKLKETDNTAFTLKTCCTEHILTSLFQLVQSIKDSLQSSRGISKCCLAYLKRLSLSKQFNLPHQGPSPPLADSSFSSGADDAFGINVG